jgi:hypothetical protein
MHNTAGEPRSIAAVRLKTILGITGIAYINGGPLCKLISKDQCEYIGNFARLCASLRITYSEPRNLILRIRPRPLQEQQHKELRRRLADQGFEPIHDAKANQTHLVSLPSTPEELRARLKQKWRNCLNASERAGLQIVRRVDIEALRDFHAIYERTAKAKGFYSDHDSHFFEKIHVDSLNDNPLRATYAVHNGRVTAGHVGHIAGDTGVYLLGGATQEGRETKAGYLLQWDFMMQCMNQGCRWYDLGGVDASDNPGVYRFKAGIGGIETAPNCIFQHTPDKASAKILRIILKQKGI